MCVCEFELGLISCNFVTKFRNILSFVLFLNDLSSSYKRAIRWWEIKVKLPLCSKAPGHVDAWRECGILQYSMEVNGQIHAPTNVQVYSGKELPVLIWGIWLGIRTGLSSVQRGYLCKYNKLKAAVLVNLEGNLRPVQILPDSQTFLSYSDMLLLNSG
jgi:hypothetical protein